MAYLEEQMEAASAVLGATTEQIIRNIKDLGIEPVYIQKNFDKELIGAELLRKLIPQQECWTN
jgi:hypothetical protein